MQMGKLADVVAIAAGRFPRADGVIDAVGARGWRHDQCGASVDHCAALFLLAIDVGDLPGHEDAVAVEPDILERRRPVIISHDLDRRELLGMIPRFVVIPDEVAIAAACFAQAEGHVMQPHAFSYTLRRFGVHQQLLVVRHGVLHCLRDRRLAPVPLLELLVHLVDVLLCELNRAQRRPDPDDGLEVILLEDWHVCVVHLPEDLRADVVVADSERVVRFEGVRRAAAKVVLSPQSPVLERRGIVQVLFFSARRTLRAEHEQLERACVENRLQALATHHDRASVLGIGGVDHAQPLRRSRV
mmetsp:Transcript_57731/g.160961  ORF Transcript_57731/g.160961 Transcript_57731/m.160961 type:complete len:300 (+) Transcript_57731:574-1473(+)